jgi:hypothetical protein
LEELMIEAPILGMRPVLLIDPSQLVVTKREARYLGQQYPILEERITADSTREYRVDRDRRIVRVTAISNKRPTGQIDIVYSKEGRVPSE